MPASRAMQSRTSLPPRSVRLPSTYKVPYISEWQRSTVEFSRRAKPFCSISMAEPSPRTSVTEHSRMEEAYIVMVELEPTDTPPAS
eukprot:scaffold284363_cov32-Tisochrysis_lutea.AAC.6